MVVYKSSYLQATKQLFIYYIHLDWCSSAQSGLCQLLVVNWTTELSPDDSYLQVSQDLSMNVMNHTHYYHYQQSFIGFLE